MSLEYGVERYGDLLSKYFNDNRGPQGPQNPGPSIIVAKEAREKVLSDNISYLGWSHVIPPNSLNSQDLIMFNLWIYAYNMTGNIDILFTWEEPSGGVASIAGATVGPATRSHYVFSYAQDTRNTSQLISTSYGTLYNGTRVVQVFDVGGFPVYNWIAVGGTVKIQITTGAGNPGALVNTRAYYYHAKH